MASAVFSALDLKNVKRNIAEVQRCTANMSKMEEVSHICFRFHDLNCQFLKKYRRIALPETAEIAELDKIAQIDQIDR